jgi:spore maturation protein CgeB
MKIVVLGKRGSVVNWAEDAIAGFQAAGHDVRFAVTRNPLLHRNLEKVLLARTLGVPRASGIVRAIRRFSPDLILAVGPFGMPQAILERVAQLPGRPPLLGWVGDMWSTAESGAAKYLDAIAYTDSGLLALHKDQGLPSRGIYLPHAANPRLGNGHSVPRDRLPSMVFVANPTQHRRALVDQIRTPMTLYGPGWMNGAMARHELHARFVDVTELKEIYRSHLAVLNIRHEINTLAGLNQRHFDPYMAATPVVADNQLDLARCFEPGREVLIYRDTDELNDIYDRLRRAPGDAAAIGERGRMRVLSEHTYVRRLEVLTKLV